MINQDCIRNGLQRFLVTRKVFTHINVSIVPLCYILLSIHVFIESQSELSNFLTTNEV